MTASRKIFYLIAGLNLFLFVVLVLIIWQTRGVRADLARSHSLPLSAEENSSTHLPLKLNNQAGVINNFFLSASTTIALLENLEKTAGQTKTKLKINRAEARDDLSLNFSVTGSYSAVSQFIILFERFPYALRLERLDLKKGDKDIWQGDFVIKALMQK